MHERGRNPAAPRAATTTTTSLFAARIEMPVVLRGGMLDDRPALVPAGLVDPASARVPRRLGTMGWITATAICAFSVYAVRDTMFAPLAQSDAPSSAWETKKSPGDTTPPLIAAPGATHLDLDEHEEIATGTTVGDSQPDRVGPSSSASGTTGTGSANTPESPSAGSSGADATTSTAEATTSSAPSTSTPDTLGGHGANSGSGKGGSGNGSASP